jgi:hypothetical protein
VHDSCILSLLGRRTTIDFTLPLQQILPTDQKGRNYVVSWLSESSSEIPRTPQQHLQNWCIPSNSLVLSNDWCSATSYFRCQVNPGRTMPTLDLSELNIIITVLGTTHSIHRRKLTTNRYQVLSPSCTVLDQSRSSKHGTLARLSQRCLRESYWDP